MITKTGGKKLGRIKTLIKKVLNKQSDRPGIYPELNASERFSTRNSLDRKPFAPIQSLAISGGESTQAARISMYRFLIDSIPALDAALWTWTLMSASPVNFEIETGSGGSKAKATEIIENLFRRIHNDPYQRAEGVQSLLTEYFHSIYSTGSVAGEFILTPQLDGISHFYFVDSATLRAGQKAGAWQIYQARENRRVYLDKPSIYFHGLRADCNNPLGRSLLKSIPFAARVEQQLLNDMHKSMHNAGYHRIHVQVTPPDRLPGETDSNYTDRANSYFEKAVSTFRDFRPEDNPVTWDDVKIEYIGPTSKISGSNAWYLNHKSIIEDICAGTHLAPFMLGYSYGTTHNWAMFKYELVQREVRAVQAAAAHFLEWLADIELALKGIDASCKIAFRNDVIYGLEDRMQAENLRLKNIILKKDAGLVDPEQAREEAEKNKIA